MRMIPRKPLVSLLLGCLLPGLPLAARPQDPGDAVAERQAAQTGAVWHVTEDGGWSGTWTQRGGSPKFDALWTRGGERVTGVLTLHVEGRHVRFQSRQQTNGFDVDYEGTLAADGRNVAGTCQVLGRSGHTAWKGRIEPAPKETTAPGLGRVWHVTEDGNWTGTWTRRRSGQVYDALWTKDGQRVTGILSISVSGRQVRIQSRKQSNGFDVDYTGTLAADGRSAAGAYQVAGRSGHANWKARIDP